MSEVILAIDAGERWLPVVGYEGLYEVSDQGRVKSLNRVLSNGHHWTGRILVTRRTTHGYLVVSLWRGNKEKLICVHRLVLEAFVGPAPEGTECCHYNDISTDNRLENLRWATHSDNMRDRVRNGNDLLASKTHCKHGHEFTPENTYYRPNTNGHRDCVQCGINRKRRWYANKKAAKDGSK